MSTLLAGGACLRVVVVENLFLFKPSSHSLLDVYLLVVVEHSRSVQVLTCKQMRVISNKANNRINKIKISVNICEEMKQGMFLARRQY